MQTSGDLDGLVARMLAKAGAEAESVLDRARQAAAREVARVRDEGRARLREEESHRLRIGKARREAHGTELAIAERRVIMQKQEQAVEQVFEAALQELAADADPERRRALLLQVVREAVDALGVEVVRARFNPADRKLAAQSDGFRSLSGVRVRVDDETLAAAGGAVLSDESGRIVYENTFEARLERRREALRLLAAEVLELRKLGIGA